MSVELVVHHQVALRPVVCSSSSRQVGSGRRLNRALRPPAADLRAAVSSLSTAAGRWIQSVPQPQPARQCCTYLQSLSLVNVLVIICEVLRASALALVSGHAAILKCP